MTAFAIAVGCVSASGAPPVMTLSVGVSASGAQWCCGWSGVDCSVPGACGGRFGMIATSDGSIEYSGTCRPPVTSVAFGANAVSFSYPYPIGYCDPVPCLCCGCPNHAWDVPRLSCTVPFYLRFEYYQCNQYYDDHCGGVPSTSYPLDPSVSGGCFMSELLGGDAPRCRAGVFQFTFCREDFDASGAIDGADLAVLLHLWHREAIDGSLYWCGRVDLNDDGQIDGSDLAFLLNAWGACQAPS